MDIDPAPELPDDTPIDRVRLPTRIRTALNDAGVKTIGEIREATDDTLLGFKNLGHVSLAYLRRTLGLPSSGGVRPLDRTRGT